MMLGMELYPICTSGNPSHRGRKGSINFFCIADHYSDHCTLLNPLRPFNPAITIKTSQWWTHGVSYGPWLFRFDTNFTKNTPSGVVWCPRWGWRPLTGNPGSATESDPNVVVIEIAPVLFRKRTRCELKSFLFSTDVYLLAQLTALLWLTKNKTSVMVVTMTKNLRGTNLCIHQVWLRCFTTGQIHLKKKQNIKYKK